MEGSSIASNILCLTQLLVIRTASYIRRARNVHEAHQGMCISLSERTFGCSIQELLGKKFGALTVLPGVGGAHEVLDKYETRVI